MEYLHFMILSTYRYYIDSELPNRRYDGNELFRFLTVVRSDSSGCSYIIGVEVEMGLVVEVPVDHVVFCPFDEGNED